MQKVTDFKDLLVKELKSLPVEEEDSMKFRFLVDLIALVETPNMVQNEEECLGMLIARRDHEVYVREVLLNNGFEVLGIMSDDFRKEIEKYIELYEKT